jgi:hypothetical protein
MRSPLQGLADRGWLWKNPDLTLAELQQLVANRLCLDQRDLVEAGLIRKPGVDLGLFDELGY